MLRSGSNAYLVRLVVNSAVLIETVAYRLSQIKVSGCGGIMRLIFSDGLYSGFLDIFGCIEIGLSHAEAESVLPFSLELFV
ncbi:hypothetical protein SDC9_176636 [bioreactor metagenome]|uniref:Uncharacterized protein n=1 Tax=bioreactor metagenome TaxID=1076179 RepID=A0A645GR67_9ZZZZ